ncbi:unnamed protein product [Rotaria sp. Silwood1]|nr:unnamed protein product [Rotaria sp. Silwood1]CAF4644261.1 unnamed protein product [Rotaria sp. Silwood1]
MSSLPTYETLKLNQPKPHVTLVELNRPIKLNAVNKQLFDDLKTCFEQLNIDKTCRAVVLSGAGKAFSSEILLLLLLGQTSTLNEAVLDWQPEYEGQRQRSHQAAYNILPLLFIFLSPLRFSFEHFQTLFNYGLSLISSGQSFRAYLILKECLRMQPKNLQVYLQLAKIILEYIYDFPSLFETFPSTVEDGQTLLKQTSYQQQYYLNQHEQRPRFIDLIDEAINYCQQAKELENPQFARSLFLLAIAKSFKARQTSIHHDRQALFQSAINDLRESIELDPYDSISHFHLAHNLSFLNQVLSFILSF